MFRFRVAVAAAVLLLVSVRYPAVLTEAGLAPLWLLLPVLVAGLTRPIGEAVLVGWLLGLLVDLFSISPFGLDAFLFAAAAYLVATIRKAVFADDARTQAALGFGVTLLVCLCLLVRLDVAHPAFAFWSHLPRAFLTAALTGLALPALLALDRRVALRFGQGGR